MDIRKQVGLTVKRLRRKKGWSQEELAHESGLHRTYISGIERGIRNPTLTIIAKLADTLEVKPEILVRINEAHRIELWLSSAAGRSILKSLV